MRHVEFWYDFSCPYAYLGSTQIERVAAEAGAEVRWHPFLLGGVFRAVDTPQDLTHALPRAKQVHNYRDLTRWADRFDVALTFPASHPRRTVTALRTLLAAPEADRVAMTHAFYRAYWVDGRAIETPEVVREIIDETGGDGAALVERTQDPAIKDELRRRTDEAIARGIFGAPTMFVEGEMFWGQDRLDFVARALR